MVLGTGQLTETAQRAKTALLESLPGREAEAVGAWFEGFYAFQLEWLLDFSRFSLALKSRQIGCSFTYGACGILWGFLGEPTSIISLGQREADEVLDKAAKHAAVLRDLGSRWARLSQESAAQITLREGARIISLPITSAGRSFSSNIILDELGYYERPGEVWDGAAGTALLGRRLKALSTPNGVGNFWHQLWTDPVQHAGYQLHQVTLDDAIAQGFPVDIDECWKLARGDHRVFDQLFRCKFLDGELQYLPTAAIQACAVEDLTCLEGDCFAGLDVGRTSDRTELVIVRRDAHGIRWVQHIETRKRTESEDIDALAALAFGAPWKCKKLVVDATGMGVFPAEQLQKRYGLSRVVPYNFSLQTKEQLATCLYEAFCGPSRLKSADGKVLRGTVRIPRSDAILIEELCGIKRIITAAANVRYESPETSKGHGDRAWALALALIHSTTARSGVELGQRNIGML